MKKEKKKKDKLLNETLTFNLKTQSPPPPPPPPAPRLLKEGKKPPSPPLDRHIKEGEYPKENREGFQSPDPKKHQIISFIKSFIRIAGYGLILFDINTAIVALIFSELIGILEELA